MKNDSAFAEKRPATGQRHRPGIELGMRCNSMGLSPISHLPNELLSKIFYHFVTSHREAYRQCVTQYRWIRAIYICRHWRDVAINCAVLWTLLPTKNVAWVKLVAERSRGALLGLELAGPIYEEPQMISRFRQACHYVSRMNHIALHHIDNLDVLYIFPSHIPSLSVLELSAHEEAHFNRTRRPWDSMQSARNQAIILPDTIFSGCPNLKLLRLGGLTCNWATMSAPSLVELSIAAIPAGSRPSIATFYTALGRMSRLESLEIHNSLPAVDSLASSTVTPTTIASLQNLKRVVLTGTIPEVTKAILAISHPPSTHVWLKIRFELYGAALTGVDKFISFLSTRSNYRCFNAVPVRTMSIEAAKFTSNEDFTLSFGPDTPRTNEVVFRAPNASLTEAPLALSFFFPETINNNPRFSLIQQQIFRRIIPRLSNLPELETLNLFEISLPSAAFGNCPRLETLTLAGPQSVQFMVLALQCDQLDSSTPISSIPFAALRRFGIRGGTFDSSPGESQNCIDPEGFCDYLAMRAARGLGIVELTIDGCAGIRRKDVEVFRFIVPVVAWIKEEDDFKDRFGNLAVCGGSDPEMERSDSGAASTDSQDGVSESEESCISCGGRSSPIVGTDQESWRNSWNSASDSSSNRGYSN